jgi:putative ABC transport system substrate-binding protein
MRRRELITLLGGAAFSWPLGAHAQQPERMRRIGVLTGRAEDVESLGWVEALRQRLKELDWSDGRNIRIDLHTDSDVERWQTPQLPGSRVLEDHYGANLNRIVILKGNPGRLAFINEFVEQAKTSGLVQKAIDRAGPRGLTVAPPGDSN